MTIEVQVEGLLYQLGGISFLFKFKFEEGNLKDVILLACAVMSESAELSLWYVGCSSWMVAALKVKIRVAQSGLGVVLGIYCCFCVTELKIQNGQLVWVTDISKGKAKLVRVAVGDKRIHK